MIDATTANETPPGAPDLATADTGQIQPPLSRARRILRGLVWFAFALFCLIGFTLLKLPDDRIKAYALGTINAQLAPKGISMTAVQGYVSLGFGISYVMKEVTLNLP